MVKHNLPPNLAPTGIFGKLLAASFLASYWLQVARSYFYMQRHKTKADITEEYTEYCILSTPSYYSNQDTDYPLQLNCTTVASLLHVISSLASPLTVTLHEHAKMQKMPLCNWQTSNVTF
jgi:hypothetical protein